MHCVYPSVLHCVKRTTKNECFTKRRYTETSDAINAGTTRMEASEDLKVHSPNCQCSQCTCSDMPSFRHACVPTCPCFDVPLFRHVRASTYPCSDMIVFLDARVTTWALSDMPVLSEMLLLPIVNVPKCLFSQMSVFLNVRPYRNVIYRNSSFRDLLYGNVLYRSAKRLISPSFVRPKYTSTHSRE